MPAPDYESVLRAARHSSPEFLHRVIAEAVGPLGAVDVVVYLVDYSLTWLQPVLAQTPPRQSPAAEEQVATTMAGRVFTTGEVLTAERAGQVRVWVPIVEHASRSGVLALTVPVADAETLRHCQTVGMLAGLLIASAARYTDVLHLTRRTRPMSLAAGIQWDLLPPLSARFDTGAVAGLLEPAYDVAGDAFDYAVNNGRLEVGIFDGMGHGIGSSVLTGLAIGAYRHARRQGGDVTDIHSAVEQAVAAQFEGESFVTGLLAQLDLNTGQLRFTAAGHPAPLLLRDRRVVGEMDVEPSLPFGLGDSVPIASQQVLQPGDGLLIYTDGVVEARTPSGHLFGVDRLSDLVTRALTGEPTADELARRVVSAVLDHQAAPLRDDATVVAVSWSGVAHLDGHTNVDIALPRTPPASASTLETPAAELVEANSTSPAVIG